MKLLCILGPTAVGKTEIAIEVAQRLNAEIVSVDSRQIYREMDIGTAKPTREEQQQARHHLIDCVDIAQPFSVADYQRLADAAIRDIQNRDKRVMLVGGAGLYFRAIVDGLFAGPGADAAIRERLRKEAENTSRRILHERLRACDAESAARIHPNNLVKVIRALEVYELTGTPISQMQQQWHTEPRYPFIAFGLTMPREKLYHRIEQRVDAMLANGLLEEVAGLLARGHPQNSTALQSFGYKELIAYLDGNCTLPKTIDKATLNIVSGQLKQNTRRFAKRQLTWFRKDSRIKWIERESTEQGVEALLGGFPFFCHPQCVRTG